MVLISVYSKQLKVEKLVNVLKFERGVRIEKKKFHKFYNCSFSSQNLFSFWFQRNVDHFSFVFELVLVKI